MSTIDKICELLKAQGKKQKDLTDYIGVSKNHFTDWKSGRIKSYTKYLPQISEFLNVSVDYLLGKEEAPPASPLDDNKKELFDHIDRMTADQLEQLKSYAKFLIDSRK